jgi:hypothetical protein
MVLLTAAALVAWRVWPTPYEDYIDHGAKDTNKRVVRWTGKVEARDPLTGSWVVEGHQLRLNQPTEAEKILQGSGKSLCTGRSGLGAPGTKPAGLARVQPPDPRSLLLPLTALPPGGPLLSQTPIPTFPRLKP